MSKQDLAITAAGNTLLELITIGIPSLVICGEKHELEIAKKLHKKKAAINLGFGKNISEKLIFEKTFNLINNYELRKNLHINSKREIDGKGLEKMIKIICEKYEKSQ